MSQWPPVGTRCYTFSFHLLYISGRMLYMAIEKVLYAVRIPVDLKRLIDNAASSGGVNTSQLVIDALWKYLDKSGKQEVSREVTRVPSQSDTQTPKTAQVPVSSPPVKMNNAMAEFMAKASIVIPYQIPEAANDEPNQSCSECDGRMTGKLIKGRGMVYACTDVSCPMYGLERQPK
jgi:hypothetical protein